jgi:3-oxoacyl-[acyl-carrier protein] reductase
MPDNKVVVITGAARGMGRASARQFLADGAKLVAIDRSWEPTGFSNDRDSEWVDELRSRPDDALVLTCDIADPGQIEAAYDAAMSKFGTADFLFNNAGLRMRDLYPPSGSTVTLETSRADWEQMFGVTVFGTIDVVKAFIRPMIAKQRGSVLTTISSGALHQSRGGAYTALRPNSREVPYQPAKAAIMCAMFYLADEVQQHNVAVNIMIPAHTRTTGFDEQTALRQIARNQEGAARAGAPSGMLPEHVVPLVSFLANQDAAAGVSGRCFDAMTWNLEHGYGGSERWVDPDGETGVEEALARLTRIPAAT